MISDKHENNVDDQEVIYEEEPIEKNKDDKNNYYTVAFKYQRARFQIMTYYKERLGKIHC